MYALSSPAKRHTSRATRIDNAIDGGTVGFLHDPLGPFVKEVGLQLPMVTFDNTFGHWLRRYVLDEIECTGVLRLNCGFRGAKFIMEALGGSLEALSTQSCLLYPEEVMDQSRCLRVLCLEVSSLSSVRWPKLLSSFASSLEVLDIGNVDSDVGQLSLDIEFPSLKQLRKSWKTAKDGELVDYARLFKVMRRTMEQLFLNCDRVPSRDLVRLLIDF